MRDLRLRFGTLLAISLMPLLTLTIIQSIFDLRKDNETRQQSLKATALSATSEFVSVIDKTQAILRVVGETVEASSGCDAQLSRVTSSTPYLSDLEIVGPSGEVICRSSELQRLASGHDPKEATSVNMPFQTIARVSVNDGARDEAPLATSYGIYEGGELQHVVVASFEIQELTAAGDSLILENGAQMVVLNDQGEVLLGPEIQGKIDREKWIQMVKDTGQFEGELRDADGARRDVLAVGSESDGVYVAVSSPRTSILSWNILNPFSSVFVALLAWMLSFTAIWFAADRLILVHLKKIQGAAINFARGNLDGRVGKMKSPPRSIYELGKNFDLMADRISEREETIIDALDERETLLREIHHRVKNNLQIIISLLNMQERKLVDQVGRNAIVETRSRINAISLVHRGLYESFDFRYIDMQKFLDRLTAELSVALGVANKGIIINVSADCDPMQADTATPVALFIVEGLTNAIKDTASAGVVNISIRQKDQFITAAVSSDGRRSEDGAPTYSDIGEKLIRGFARQLGGDVNVEDGVDGYVTTLKFQLRTA